jgi:hypothetical protein
VGAVIEFENLENHAGLSIHLKNHPLTWPLSSNLFVPSPDPLQITGLDQPAHFTDKKTEVHREVKGLIKSIRP